MWTDSRTAKGPAPRLDVDETVGTDLADDAGTLVVHGGPTSLDIEALRESMTVAEVNQEHLAVEFYSLTKTGARQLRVEVANWEKATALVARVLEAKA